jgi:uncharacterized protein (DUF1330 family)
MPGYIIANYTINDPETYAKYPPAVGPTIAQYGGKVLVADGEVKAVEGHPQPVTVVLEFESVEAARRWHDSPEYTAIKGLRTSSTEGWLAIADGFVPPQG